MRLKAITDKESKQAQIQKYQFMELHRLDQESLKNILKTVASGVVANLGGYVVLLGAGELLKFIPVFGSFVGAAIESGIAYAITIVSAYVYIKAITLMARKRIDFNNEEKLQHEVDEILRNDKEEIKAMLKEAKNSYKPQK